MPVSALMPRLFVAMTSESIALSRLNLVRLSPKEVPAYALMAGTPARRIGWMSRAGARIGNDFVCPEDGTKYRQVSEDQIEEIVIE